MGLIFIQSFRLWLGQYNDESSCPGQDKALLKINILFLLPFVSHLFNLTKFTLCVREKIPFFCIQLLFKGGVSRDFLPQFFFHKLNPSRPLINRLERFFLKIRFREDIRI